MKVYFLFYSYECGLSADIGGFRKLWELADRFRIRGHKTRVFFPDLPGYKPLQRVDHTAYKALNFKVFRPISAYIMMFIAAMSMGLKERPDIIYFRFSVNILAIILAKLLGAKVILEINADFRDFMLSDKMSWARFVIFWIAEKINVAGADRIVVLTEGLKKRVVINHGIDESNICVIPSGTDIDFLKPMDIIQARRLINENLEGFVVGFVGIFYKHQGVHTLISASRHVLDRFKDVSFMVVGEGVMREEWEYLADSLGVRGSFKFTGKIPYARLPEYINSMNITVAPFTSDRGEVSPFKVLDSLSCGRPVIVSRISSMESMINEFGGSVIPFTPDDPQALADVIVSMARDRSSAGTLGEIGRKIVAEKYGWGPVADNLMNTAKSITIK